MFTLYQEIGFIHIKYSKPLSLQTVVYGDLFFYNLNKKEWTVVKAPGAPPPRCGHQAAIVPTGKGDLWIFGGEFSSPSESQFYHYRDLWVYHIGEKKWEKIKFVFSFLFLHIIYS